jgi:hypothetical protein
MENIKLEKTGKKPTKKAHVEMDEPHKQEDFVGYIQLAVFKNKFELAVTQGVTATDIVTTLYSALEYLNFMVEGVDKKEGFMVH